MWTPHDALREIRAESLAAITGGSSGNSIHYSPRAELIVDNGSTGIIDQSWSNVSQSFKQKRGLL
jgi:hypothetical protein